MAKKKADAVEKTPLPEISEVKAVSRVKSFSLPNNSILVRYIKRQKGNISNKNHIAYGGMLEGSIQYLNPKKGANGQYVNVLSDLEQSYLEKKLALDEGGLSIYKKEGNFFKELRPIPLTKEGFMLDLSDPVEYIKYKVLLSYSDLISPSVTETGNKRTYRFEMVAKGDDDKVAKKGIDYKRQAYKILSNIEDNRDQLAAAIRLTTGKKVSTESGHEWLIGQVGNEIEKNAKSFCEIMTDDLFEIKHFIEKGIDKKAIVKDRGLYRTIDGIDLCYEGDIPTLEKAIVFLTDIQNQDIKLLIQSKINK